MGQLTELRSKRVVVTGGAGFIGSHLCDALLESDNTVTCIDNLVGTGGSTRNVAHLLDDPRFQLFTESVLDWSDGADLTDVDCVFHLAASKHAVSLLDPERDLAVNALGTLRLLLRAARCGVSKLVHASTGSVFGETSRVHVEGNPKHPVSPYGISKLAGESYCRVIDETFGLEYAPARPGDIHRFAVDNTKIRRLGIDFDTDWRSMVREVIASLRPTAAVQFSAGPCSTPCRTTWRRA